MPILGMQSLIPIGIQFRSKYVNLENSMEALLEYVLLFIIKSFLFFLLVFLVFLVAPQSIMAKTNFLGDLPPRPT